MFTTKSGSKARCARRGFRSFGEGLRGIAAIEGDGTDSDTVRSELDGPRNFRQSNSDASKEGLREWFVASD